MKSNGSDKNQKNTHRILCALDQEIHQIHQIPYGPLDPRKKSSQLPTLTTVSMAGLVADAASYGRWWYGWPSCPGRTGCAGRHANSSHRHTGRARCTGRHTWGDTHHAGTTRSGWSWVGEPRDPSGQRFFLCDERNSMNMDLTMICNFAKYCYQILLNHISNTDEYLNLDPWKFWYTLVCQ